MSERPEPGSATALEAASEQRAELDQLRAEAYRGLDLVLAPSRHLIGELERGGFERGRIEHQPLGFDNDDLAGLPSVRPDPGRPVRFAYLGGMPKHKGVHVLLDAFARLGGRAELSLWGASSDRAYVELLRRRCGEVGAQWRGPYGRADERAILAGIDALVVPSIWVENQPLVIHEAFSAGRPVLASHLGAIPEFVHDGVNGLLFAPGDAADLARVLARCTDEPELLPTLARGIGPVKGMDQEVRELVPRYERLLAARHAARVALELPESLAGAMADFERLSALPSRELFTRTLAGLDELRAAWSADLGPTSAVELLAAGLGEGSEAQDRLREARNEITWLREGREELVTVFQDLERVLGEAEGGRQIQAEQLESAGTYVRQKEAEVSQAHERMHALEGVIAEKNRHIGEVEGHLHEAGRYIRHKDQEYLDLEDQLRQAGEYAHAKEGELRAALVHAREREEELRSTGESAQGLAEDLRRADETARGFERELRTTQESERELDLGARTVGEVAVMALHAQERVLNRALRPVLERLHALIDPEGRLQLPAEGASFAELLENLGLVRDGLDALGKELEWMRPQRAELLWCRERMTRLLALYEKSSFVRLLLKPTALGGKLRKWSEANAREEPRA
ncbi:MAG: glycosyltransferase [Planctomycetes bacterium]|nr:glycosyltransferase [Planctomycetota bacterium]